MIEKNQKASIINFFALIVFFISIVFVFKITDWIISPIWNLNPNLLFYIAYPFQIFHLVLIYLSIRIWFISTKISSRILLIVIVINIFGLIFSMAGFPRQDLVIWAKGERVTGEITNINFHTSQGRRSGTICRTEYTFNPRTGTANGFGNDIVSTGWCAQHEIGDKIYVRYLPENQTQKLIESSVDVKGNASASITFNLVAFIATLIVVISSTPLNELKTTYDNLRK